MKELFAAMAQAFPKIEGALKDSNNPHFKSKYADLTSVVIAIKPALQDHGLFFTQHVKPDERGVQVQTCIGHESGEHMECGWLFLPASKHDAQGFGSALTYARRYSLMAAFGVCPEDDDGNGAVRMGKDDGGNPPAPPKKEGAPKVNGRYVMPDGPAKTMNELEHYMREFVHNMRGEEDPILLAGYVTDALPWLDQAREACPHMFDGSRNGFSIDDVIEERCQATGARITIAEKDAA